MHPLEATGLGGCQIPPTLPTRNNNDCASSDAFGRPNDFHLRRRLISAKTFFCAFSANQNSGIPHLTPWERSTADGGTSVRGDGGCA